MFLLADLTVGVQTAARAPFAHCFSGIHNGEGWRFELETKESLFASQSYARRSFRSTGRNSGVGTSRVRSLPAGTGYMALKPPFSSLYYCSEVPGLESSTPVPWLMEEAPAPPFIKGTHKSV